MRSRVPSHGPQGPSLRVPVTEVYGPSFGPAAVRSGAGPRTVTAPGGAVTFSTIAGLVTAIGANSPDTDFVATASSYSVTSNGQITWADGKRPRIWFPGAPGTRTITSTGDFIGISAPSSGTEESAYFEVHGGTWTGFGTTGSANVRAAFIRRGNALIEDCEVTQSHFGSGTGGNQATWTSSNALVSIRYCHFHHCWASGIGDGGFGNGNGQYPFLIEYCELDNNNQDLNSPGGDVAGAKLLFQVGTYRNNYVHDNLSWGLWWDTANRDTAAVQVQTPGAIHVYDNVCEGNSRPGIFLERSGYGRLNNNYLIGNGNGGTIGGQAQTTSNGWQMLVRNGSFHEVDHNDVDMETGVARTLAIAQQSEELATEQNVHDNRVWLRTSSARVGGYDDNTVETLWSEASIDWTNNLYKVGSLSDSYWQWNTNEALNSWATWQGFGFDASGTRELV